MGRAIAKTPEETAVVKWDDIAWDDDGTEDVRPSFPLVKMVQAVSTMNGSTKQIGNWWRSDTEEYLQSPLPVGVLAMRRSRAIFEKGTDTPLCRSDDAVAPAPRQELWDGRESFVGQNGKVEIPNYPQFQPVTCAACPFSQWVNDEPPQCKVSLVLMADINVDGETPEFAQIRLSATSIGPFEKLVARRIRPKNRRLAQFRFELGSEEAVGGGNKYQRLTVHADDLPMEKALQYQAALREMRSAFDRESTRHENDEGDGGEPVWETVTPKTPPQAPGQAAFVDVED